MIAPGPSLRAALDRLSELDFLPDAARPAVLALRGGVDVERVGSALAALRAADARAAFDELAEALGQDHGAIVVAEALPGAGFPGDLDVRTARPRKMVRNWHGDLLVEPSFSPRGASVTVGSRRGAEALAGLDRSVRAAVVALDVLHAVGDDLGGLTAVWHDGVRSLSPSGTSPGVSAALIQRCTGLAWTASEEISAVAEATFARGVVSWSDYFTGGGLWGPGFQGP